MKIITITGPAPGYTAHEQGHAIASSARLVDLRDPLLERLRGSRGKIVYQRPSWPDRTSPVVLADSRPVRGYLGGAWVQ
ncbi:hypothetical protein [Achromobacter xylosoxidans]|uniref:hypothetical protein n=1 Tax=Alcaligenes xylosoxydans xylosoxydans TaxID=85698 RepID=UPI002A7588F8|nr:hypothetical protein [Achromobacter xylosoxidans]WPQ35131.1 hypothetical protein SLH34_31775 [Achromobacter xylosoxidans]